MPYIASEHDINNVVRDFLTFCDYVGKTKPFATQKGGLSTKGCFEVNQLLCQHRRKDAKGNKTIYDITEKYAIFKEMNVFTQYLLIFNTWYCFVDIEVLNAERGSRLITNMLIDCAFKEFTENGCVRWILRDKNKHGCYGENMVQLLFDYSYKTAVVLMNFGLIIFEESDEKSAYFNHLILAKIKPTPLGLCIMNACETRKYSWYNIHVKEAVHIDEIEVFETSKEAVENGTEEFLTLFLHCFPEGTINTNSINKILYGYEQSDESGDSIIFDFKVSLNKKCYRIIRCLPQHAFEDLHLAIQDAFDFGDDHLYSFYLSGERYSDFAVHSPHALELPYADEVCLCDIRLRDKQRILYLFDYGTDWEFDVIVHITAKCDESFKNPEIVSSMGESPEQYPSYDDF